jgi:hypothetical protein
LAPAGDVKVKILALTKPTAIKNAAAKWPARRRASENR